MIKIIPQEAQISEMPINQLSGNESIAFASKQGNIRILARLKKYTYGAANDTAGHWGFIPLTSTGEPSFIADTFHACVLGAVKSRKLFIYTTIAELVQLSKTEQP